MNQKTYVDGSYAQRTSDNAGINFSTYDFNINGGLVWNLLDGEIERAANLGKKAIFIMVRKYNYNSVIQSYTSKGFRVCMPQADVEYAEKLIDTPNDPNKVINTPYDKVVVKISWH